jgi:hypothetical protein
MSLFSSFKHRYLTKRTIDTPATILLWWGSHGYTGGPTVGDLMAVENLSQRLHAVGHEHGIISHPELGLPGHFPADDICAIKSVERLVFVCGPLTDSSVLRDVLAIQVGARKIAAGVSVLANHEAMTRRFDCIIARDGTAHSYFDLAVDKVELPQGKKSGKIAICLRGRQSEYGKSRYGMADKAARLINELIATTDLKPVVIDTVMSRQNRAEDILSKFSSVDAVLTTRMHGALLGLAAGKPVLALDQIPGGAKVKNVVARTGWPLVGNVANMDKVAIHKAFERLIAPGIEDTITAAQAQILALTGEALAAASEAVISS